MERELTISFRSVTRGRRRIFSVRKPLHFLWSAPINDALVFVLFLFVSALHHRHHITLTIAQSRYVPLGFQTWVIICKWYSINPRYLTVQTVLSLSYNDIASGILIRGMLGSYLPPPSRTLMITDRRTAGTPMTDPVFTRLILTSQV